MPAAESQLDRIQQHHLARFEAMGLTARPMPDGRSLLVSLPVGPTPFESLTGPIVVTRIVFATVGSDRIKCLRPRPLFELPMLDIKDCGTPSAIEAAVRRVFRERIQALRAIAKKLGELRMEAEPSATGTILGFALSGEPPSTRILIDADQHVILPSAGSLSGFPLASPRERVLAMPEDLASSADLECLVAAQIDSLKRSARKREAAERAHPAPLEIRSAADRTAPTGLQGTPLRHHPKVLLVGPTLVGDASLRQEFKRQGYRTATARSETEALVRLAGMTPDLVVSEYALGRSDGATLVQATRALAGIEGIPIVLLDDSSHENRKAAARAVGAAGYVILPAQKKRFVTRLGRLLDEPKARRFTRYPGRFSARLAGLPSPCVVTEVGRGGVFIATDAEIDLHSAMSCELMLPEIRRELRFEGQVLYRAEGQGSLPGLGLRFSDISAEDEAALIDYLTRLESQRR